MLDLLLEPFSYDYMVKAICSVLPSVAFVLSYQLI